MRTRSVKFLGVGLAFVVLVFGSVVVLRAIDRDSHSASDSLRPFLISMVPVWSAAVVGAIGLLRRR